jgi:hypothetical protein
MIANGGNKGMREDIGPRRSIYWSIEGLESVL